MDDETARRLFALAAAQVATQRCMPVLEAMRQMRRECARRIARSSAFCVDDVEDMLCKGWSADDVSEMVEIAHQAGTDLVSFLEPCEYPVEISERAMEVLEGYLGYLGEEE